MARVLVVDDDTTVREVVASYLRAAGHDVEEAEGGRTALAADRREHADLVILDLMMPDGDGWETCRRLRATRDVPVIMLTARAEESERVTGLELGADDYVVKPFSPRELVLRVRSVLRRVTPDASTAVVRIDGDLVLDEVRREVTLAGAQLALTAREFELLQHFVAHPGVAFTRQQLLRVVWGWEVGDVSTVTVHVRRVREKVEADPAAPHRLVTVWGVGYRWEAAT